MHTFWQDVRYGVRALFKRPGFTLVAVLVLALGVGGNSAIFSVVNAVLLRPLPLKNAERIVVPVSTNAERGFDGTSVAYADFLDWKNDERLFERVAVFQERDFDLTGDGEPERISTIVASEDYGAVVGAEMLVGRALGGEDSRPESPRTAVLSHGLWQRRFGGRSEIVGQPITLNGQQHVVVGVLGPRHYAYPDGAELWMPLVFSSDTVMSDLLRRDNFIFQCIALLKPGVSVAQADARLAATARRIEEENYASRKGWSARAVPINEYIVGPTLRAALLVLLGAVGLVLLIACVNVANLLLARAAVREREMAVRMALGAGRWRIVRQLLVESLILGSIGGMGGLLLAVWGVDVLISLAPPDIPRLQDVSIDAGVLAFALLVSLVAAILFGALPALHASRAELQGSLKEGGRGTTGGLRGQRARGLLVVIELALSLVLLIGAGLLVKSFLRLQQVDPGFNVDNLLSMEISLPRARYAESRNVTDTFQNVLERLKNLPGVQTASAASALPLGGGGFYLGRVFLEEGKPEPPDAPDYQGDWNVITAEYFSTLKMQLVKGRVFSERDAADSTPVVIINETLARRMFPDAEPLGKRIRSWRDENKLREIVGVVKDVRYMGRDDEARGLVYVPHSQNAWRSMVIAVRTDGDPLRLSRELRNVIWSVDQNLAVANVTTMRQTLVASTARPQFSMLLLSLFAAVALILAGVGIYGVMSYSVAQRTHEIGIRMAMGARTDDVLKLILRQGLKLTLAGLAVGLIGAFALTRLMSTLLYGVSATDPTTFGLVSVFLAGLAMLACYLPARRATKVDPLVALRYE